MYVYSMTHPETEKHHCLCYGYTITVFIVSSLIVLVSKPMELFILNRGQHTHNTVSRGCCIHTIRMCIKSCVTAARMKCVYAAYAETVGYDSTGTQVTVAFSLVLSAGPEMSCI